MNDFTVDIDKALRKAETAYNMGMFDVSQSIIETGLQNFPQSQELAVALGNILLQRGDFKKAEECFLKTVMDHPDSILGHLNLAGLYLRIGAIPEAVSSAVHVINRDDKDQTAAALCETIQTEVLRQISELSLSLGILLTHQERLSEAIPHFEHFLKLGLDFKTFGHLEPLITDFQYKISKDTNPSSNATLITGIINHINKEFGAAKTAYELAHWKDTEGADLPAGLRESNIALGLPEEHDSFSESALDNVQATAASIARGDTILTCTPTTITLGMTTVCNINPPCVMCWKHIDSNLGYLKRDAHHISETIYEHLLPFIRRSTKLLLHGAGEPLTCDYLFKPLKYINSEHTKVEFTSNGLILDSTRINKILDAKIDMINFSLDAATPATYRKIRGNDFERVTGNIKNLIRMRNERGLEYPKIYINMCLMRENMAELPAFVDLGQELSASEIHAFHMNKGVDYTYEWFDYKNQHCDLDPETHDTYVNEAIERAKNTNIPLLFYGGKTLLTSTKCNHPTDGCCTNPIATEKQPNQEPFFCDFPWSKLLIGTEGEVMFCCYMKDRIGDLKHSSIWEIWNGELAQEIRKSTLNHQMHPACMNHNNPCPKMGRI